MGKACGLVTSHPDVSHSIRRTFSAIIPTSARPELLLLAVESARQQTYAPLEIIVVDNDPTGSAQDVLKPLINEDERLRYLAAASVRNLLGVDCPPLYRVSNYAA